VGRRCRDGPECDGVGGAPDKVGLVLVPVIGGTLDGLLDLGAGFEPLPF